MQGVEVLVAQRIERPLEDPYERRVRTAGVLEERTSVKVVFGQSGSICDTSYQDSLQQLGQLILHALTPDCLAAPLADPKHPDCTIEDLAAGGDGGATVVHVPYCGSNQAMSGEPLPCWRLQAWDGSNGRFACPPVYDPGDSMHTPQQFAVTIDSPPALQLRASYRTLGPPDGGH
jgi:hypothetical protein